MTYVFDTSPFSALFKSYYPSVFKTLWSQFDGLVAAGQIVSTREVKREIDNSSIDLMRTWADQNPHLFPSPNSDEGAFLTQIFAVPHFQGNIEQQKISKGGIHADAFVIARASCCSGTVVTLELLKPHAAKIPNICEHFNIPCMSLQEFMENEGWVY